MSTATPTTGGGIMGPIMEPRGTATQTGTGAPPAARLYTVGHSNHPCERFMQLLRAAGVTTVADVRSSPFSRRLPHFNRPGLERALRPLGIAYSFLGDLLGGRPEQPDVYA